MLMLMPDARFDGTAEFEQAVVGNRAEVRVYQAEKLDDIPEDVWKKTDGLMVWGRLPCDVAMLDRAINCRVVIRMGVGFDVIDIEEAGKRGIAACNVPDYGTTDVADHAIGLMLALTRGIVRHHTALVDEPVAKWRAIDTPVVRRARGATYGIIGCGRIGIAAGLRAKALGMNVLFYDPYVPDGGEQSVGFERCETLEELLQVTDVVSVHTPLTEKTRGIINAEALSHMKPNAILINTSRGEVVDVDAVVEALKMGRIAATGLDVLPKEPPDPGHPLFVALKNREEWTVGRVIVTPHAAWYSPDGARDCREKAARTVINYLTEGTLRNCVNLNYLKTGEK
ncbi:MAG: putative 2-hydroxyacid dehydrogenase [Alphaproteobacteria bacterium MarineAlpha4_Bin2]|nr:MAG: putative 2-hydroxyacid dehydrogenase [Alphaproteobacteria bacterium MarineAlpha4_Bin2]